VKPLHGLQSPLLHGKSLPEFSLHTSMISVLLHSPSPHVGDMLNAVKAAVNWDSYKLRVGVQYRYCVDCGWEKRSEGVKVWRSAARWKAQMECISRIVRNYQHVMGVSPSETLLFMATDNRTIIPRVKAELAAVGTLVENPLVDPRARGFINSKTFRSDGPTSDADAVFGSWFCSCPRSHPPHAHPPPPFLSPLLRLHLYALHTLLPSSADYLMAAEGDVYISTGTSWRLASQRTYGIVDTFVFPHHVNAVCAPLDRDRGLASGTVFFPNQDDTMRVPDLTGTP
jgi:hypothetical protein